MINKVILILKILLIIVLLFCFIESNSFAISQTTSTDINSIDSNTYPQIKEMLQQLKAEHPKWNFKILYTDLDWNEVIANEYIGHGSSPRNLVPANSNYADEWICPTCGNKTYDSGSWRCASQKAIQYMMDPRNSLNSSDIFQFMELTYTNYNIDTIRGMVQNSSFWNNESYINAIISSAQKYNVNAYYIVARILQEQGPNGSTLVKGQGYNGQYVGVYNVFNIGATGNGQDNVILNGLARAQQEGWTSIEKAIDGGVQIIASSYISKGQNTIYLQKFDVDNSDNKLYWHQYMTNLFAAQNEGAKLRSTFEEYNSLEKEYTFIIPVYKNMPSNACKRPNDQGQDITIDPSYGDLVKCNADPSLRLRDAPNGNDTGERIYNGEIVTRIEKATEKINGTYWDKIKKSNGVEGYVARETYANEPVYKLYLEPINNEEPNTPDITDDPNDDIVKNEKIKVNNTKNEVTTIPSATVKEIKELLNTDIVVKNSNGEVIDENSKLATGYIVNDKYKIAVLGDVNGDGEVDARDSLRILKNSVGTYDLSGEYSIAADLNKDGFIDARDSLRVLKYSVNTYKIEI